MEFLGQIIEILRCIGPPLCKYIEYHRKLEEYKKHLKRILDELQGQKDGIELRLKAECGFGNLTKLEVQNWLINVQKIIDEEKNIEDTLQKVKCFSRVLRAKLVDKKIQEAKEYYEKGTSLSSFNSLVITLPRTRLVGETTAKKDMEEIWGHLMGNEIQKIGVCGMGGAGKTTIMTHINNRLIEENKFNHVIWVTISQTLDLIKVQNGIANALKISLSGIKDHRIRVGTLLSMIKGKRFVLILDNVWEPIRLEEIGIPEPTEENGCKLVITTRSLDVCRSMGCKTVQVKPLSEKEALELFLEKAELDISKVPTLEETVELMVKQCAGLPLAIVTIASSLKGEDDLREWNIALHELSNTIRSIKVNDDEVFVRLKFSYDRLKDERIQCCFLYCALYPKDHDIPKKELVDCWIAEGLVDEMVTLQATEDRARVIIKSLVNNCLLLESLDNRGRSCVKLHDVVRDMTIKYITSRSPLFMVKAGLKLDELPSEREWKENLDKVSLMKNRVREIPSSLSPNCHILSTLLLQDNPLESIPNSFFYHMHGLKILNLSGTQIESLPDSISELTNLTALMLQNCGSLKHVPSLARLRALAKLELGYTAINEVPAGMEMLANLTSLDLLCSELHMIPAGIFSKLRRLQKLRVSWGLQTQVAVEEVARLKNLDCLLAQFRNLQDFNCYAKSLNSQRGPNEYCLLLSPEDIKDSNQLDLSYWRLWYDNDVNKVVILEGCNICGREEDSIVFPKEVEVLMIGDPLQSIPESFFTHMHGLKILNLSGTQIESLPNSLSELTNLSALLLQNCRRLKRVPESFFSHMHRLKILNLSGTQIESLPNSISELTNLTALMLQNCGSLKHVPSLARLRALAKLELGYTAINEVPAGMEMLANLTSLDLLCSELHMLPAGIFSKLCRLQKLRVSWGLQTRVAVEEVARLKNLDCLLAQFRNLQDFNCYAKSLNSQRGPNEYCLLLSPEDIKDSNQLDLSYWRLWYDNDVNKVVILEGCNICGREEDSIVLPKEVEVLMIGDPLQSIPESFFTHMHGLKILNLSGTQIESLPNSLSELTNLSALLLQNCRRLKRVPESFFSHMHRLKILNLSGTQIESLPNSISELTNLTELLLQNCSRLKCVPESFFSHMHRLKILNLSGTQIESLPNSISELTNLTALLLQNCSRLKCVPSLARLGALEKLELGNTGINEVPTGMEMLANLTSLDLLSEYLNKIPAGIFSKLCRLHKLQVHWGCETLRVAVEEVARLKNLDSFVARFLNLQDFNSYVKYLNSQGRPNEYCLFLNNDRKSINDWKLNYDVNKAVILNGCNICGGEEDSIILPKEVESLVIIDCGDVRTMRNIPTFNTLERLEILRIENLGNLTGILLNASKSLASQCPHLKSGQYSHLKVFVGRDGRYSHLKVVHINECPQLMKLFSSNLLSELKNLEQIDVRNCQAMEELIAAERSPKEFLLPKLKRLTLYRLPKLKSICSCNGLVMVCDSLQVIDLWECSKLKKILSSSSKLQLGVLKNLEEINVQHCWEMEEIIAIDDVDCKKELIISLPKLRWLTLKDLPELKSIINVCGSNGVMVCDSLQEIFIWGCPQLKHLPIYLPIDEKGELSPPPALNKIGVTREWWEALEWDHLHPSAKTLLLPFCEFD